MRIELGERVVETGLGERERGLAAPLERRVARVGAREREHRRDHDSDHDHDREREEERDAALVRETRKPWAGPHDHSSTLGGSNDSSAPKRGDSPKRGIFGRQLPVREVNVDSSRTQVPPLVLRTTTVTSLTGLGCPDPQVTAGEVLSVPLKQFQAMKVSTR